jgi:hypothetical protein
VAAVLDGSLLRWRRGSTRRIFTPSAAADVHEDLDALPELPLTGPPQATELHQLTTGTDDLQPSRKFAPEFAPTPVHSGQTESFPDKTAERSSSPKCRKSREMQCFSGFSNPERT